MSKYKERLWRELVREHGAELAEISRPARHGRVARPRLLAGTTVGLAGLGTAIALLLSAASSSPAFAVSQNHDGTVRVVIWRIDALHSVNARLAQLGFRARFVQVAPGCAAPPPALLAAALARKQVKADWVKAKNGSLTAKFDPKQIPAGRTLVMTAWRHGQAIKVGPGHIVVGATPNCVRTFATAPGAVVRMFGKGDVVHCVVAGPLQPADNPPSTTTDGVPATTTGSVPTTTTPSGVPATTTGGVPTTTTPGGVPATTTGSVPTTTTGTGTPPPGAGPVPHQVKAAACPPGATAKVLRAIDLARRAAGQRH
jgi:hypothetical protein